LSCGHPSVGQASIDEKPIVFIGEALKVEKQAAPKAQENASIQETFTSSRWFKTVKRFFGRDAPPKQKPLPDKEEKSPHQIRNKTETETISFKVTHALKGVAKNQTIKIKRNGYWDNWDVTGQTYALFPTERDGALWVHHCKNSLLVKPTPEILAFFNTEAQHE